MTGLRCLKAIQQLYSMQWAIRLTQHMQHGMMQNVPSGASFQFRSGDCHDGMSFFGLNNSTGRYDSSASEQGLLVMNHRIHAIQHSSTRGHTHGLREANIQPNGQRPEDEVIREVNCTRCFSHFSA